jgi:hypothetical protein
MVLIAVLINLNTTDHNDLGVSAPASNFGGSCLDSQPTARFFFTQVFVGSPLAM